MAHGGTGRTCAVCQAPCPPPFRTPTAEMAPDLDGRPGEPARSTLPRWVAVCKSCGAAGPDLASLPQAAAAVVRAPGYAEEPDRFLRWAAIAAAAGDVAAQSEAVLQAAWVLEDRGEDAAGLRLRAAALWQGDPLRKLDILRRAGAFDAARALAGSFGRLDAEAGRILAFETSRIEAGDRSRHSIASVLPPPARTPHVTHGQKSAAGFLARRLERWFGR